MSTVRNLLYFSEYNGVIPSPSSMFISLNSPVPNPTIMIEIGFVPPLTISSIVARKSEITPSDINNNT